MALSEHEQKVLAELEKQLSSEEPHLSASMSGTAQTEPLTARHWAVAVAGGVAGLGIVLAGVLVKSPVLGALGFLMLALSLYLVFGRGEGSPSRRRRQRVAARPEAFADSRSGAPHGSRPGSRREGRGGRGRPSSSGFMKSLEDKWDQRRER